MATAQPKRSPRRFKSAEKPVSLHPLSFKDAVVALLQVGPLDEDIEEERAGAQGSQDG